MTSKQIQTIIEQVKATKVSDRYVLTRFRSSLPKQQAVNQSTTAEIAMNHGNNKSDSSAIDKLYGSELSTVTSIIRQLRETGKQFGFPYWQAGTLTTGVNMMPASAYGKFFDRVQALNAALENEVQRLVEDWDGVLVRRAVALASLYRPEQYPTAQQFKDAVQAKYTINPVPDGSALQKMVDGIAGDAAEALQKDIQNTDDDQRTALAESLHRQLVKFAKECRNVEAVLSKDKPRIFTTLYDELRGIVEGLTNAGFSTIEEIAAPMLTVVSEDPKSLVGEPILQAETADVAKQAADEAEMVAKQLASML